MKALIFSDSHGSFQSIFDAVTYEGSTDMIIFAGDVQRDADEISKTFRNIPFEYVLGNNDWFVSGVPNDRVFEFGGKTIFLTHGHMYGVKSSLYDLRQKARGFGADVCIFGHTHEPFCEEQDDILMLNPGSSRFTYMTLEVSGGSVYAELKSRP